MKHQLFKKSVTWMRTYIVTLLLAISSFSFFASEWKTVFNVGKGMYEVAKPFAEKWIEQI